MPKDPQIVIQRMIVHKVDQHNYDAPQLSDLETPVNDEVASFLRRHIVTNREHRYARAAVFCPPPGDPPAFPALCDQLLAEPEQFVPLTQEIARRLFATIKDDARVSAGDLVLCTFTEDAEPSPWLALLKMDPEDGFVGVRETVKGQTRVVLQRVQNVFPSGELQKCAFILPRALRKKRHCDLRVLDQQAARFGAEHLIASFFVDKFLQCTVGLNREDVTRAFAYGSYDWAEQRLPDWEPQTVEAFEQQVNTSLQKERVDVGRFAEAHIADADERDSYVEHLRERGLEDLTFEPDPTLRQRLTQFVVFEGDNGLQVRLRTADLERGNVLQVGKDDGGRALVTITTGQWRQRFKR
jgi:hypothetical protein